MLTCNVATCVGVTVAACISLVHSVAVAGQHRPSYNGLRVGQLRGVVLGMLLTTTNVYYLRDQLDWSSMSLLATSTMGLAIGSNRLGFELRRSCAVRCSVRMFRAHLEAPASGALNAPRPEGALVRPGFAPLPACSIDRMHRSRRGVSRRRASVTIRHTRSASPPHHKDLLASGPACRRPSESCV